MDADEVAAIETTWAKRLSQRQPPRSALIEGVAVRLKLREPRMRAC